MVHRSLSQNTPDKNPAGPLLTVAGRAWVSYAQAQGFHLIHTLESLLILHLVADGRETRREVGTMADSGNFHQTHRFT